MFAVVTPEYFLRDGTRVKVPNLDGSETIAAYCGGSAEWKVAARVSYLSPDAADSLAKHLTSAVSLEEETVSSVVFRGGYAACGYRNAEYPGVICVVRDVSMDIAGHVAKWMRISGWAYVTVRYEH